MTPVVVVLLDIEGTVCPISFVKDTLNQWALRALPAKVDSMWDKPEFARYRDAFPPEHTATKRQFREHVMDLMSRDVKVPYLKSLQGYMWQEGYELGQLTTPLFDDVAPKMSSWKDMARKIVIYSSGSVHAQKLLFRYTDEDVRDLTPMIDGYFDTVNAGPKTEAASYGKIASQYPGTELGHWLFLSDNVEEVEAAKEAGMQAFVVERPGNTELSEAARKQHTVIQNFDDI